MASFNTVPSLFDSRMASSFRARCSSVVSSTVMRAIAREGTPVFTIYGRYWNPRCGILRQIRHYGKLKRSKIKEKMFLCSSAFATAFLVAFAIGLCDKDFSLLLWLSDAACCPTCVGLILGSVIGCRHACFGLLQERCRIADSAINFSMVPEHGRVLPYRPLYERHPRRLSQNNWSNSIVKC